LLKIRQTIKDFIAAESWLKIVGEAADGDQAVSLIDELRPDLVFLDVRMRASLVWKFYKELSTIQRLCLRPPMATKR
jgi:chemotaxis response regulator CheB